jgi:hypothetical protein
MTKPLRPMRVLVTGGRETTLKNLGLDPGAVYALVVKTLNQLSACGQRPITVIHGGAKGVDSYADKWCFNTNTAKLVFPVAKEEWEAKGGIAGNLRNTQMLNEGKPDVCLAFPGGGGTADMMKKARDAGVRVVTVMPGVAA